MISYEYLNILNSLPFFDGLAQQEKDALLKDGTIINYPSETYLFRHGDQLKYFYIICEGIIKLFRTNMDGYEKTIDILIAKDTIGKIDIFESSPIHKASAITVENSTVMRFPKSWLMENAKKYNILAMNLLAVISHQLAMTEAEVEQQATMTSAQLVSCFLQKLCFLYNFDPKNFELPYSKALIASRLGIEVETFSRTLTKLRDHGIVVNGSHVSIQNLDKVHQYSCDHCAIEEECLIHKNLGKFK